jgi:circadian clock protein KaiB
MSLAAIGSRTRRPGGPFGWSDAVSTYQFTLFIAGESPRSTRAVENLRSLASGALEGDFELVVVDVTVDPAEAEAAQIMATPTVIKRLPEPVRRVTGDLSDPDAVALALGLPR